MEKSMGDQNRVIKKLYKINLFHYTSAANRYYTGKNCAIIFTGLLLK